MKKKHIRLFVLVTLMLVLSLGSVNSAVAKEDISRIIVMAQQYDVTSMDPHGHNDVESGDATRMIYDNLVRLTPDNQFVPMLLESWEYLDDNTVEMVLREGVKFHNGDTLTTADVKFSLERQSKSGFGSHLLTMIKEIEVIDDLTLRLHVTDESAALMSGLAHLCSAIVPMKHTQKLEAQGKTLSEDPVGTGPYYLDYWHVGSEYQLLRFEDYYDDKYKAKNAGLRVRCIPEETSRVISLETGEIDVLLAVPTASIENLQSNPSIKLLEYPSTHLTYIALNCSKPPFDNQALREAVAYCVNRDDIIQVQTDGYAVPNYAPIGIAAIGYTEPDVKREYSIKKAKEKLVEAGYPDGFSFTLSVLGEGMSRAAAVVQAACAQAGIDVKIEIMEIGPLTAHAGGAKADAGLSWWVANAEPDNTYTPHFDRKLIGAGAFNWCSYDNDELDFLVKEGRRVTDPVERENVYRQINNLVAERAIQIPLYSEKGFVATRANVDGIVLYSIMMHLFQGIVVD